MRVAVYARYSSDLQDSRSITDQVALASERAAKEGWTVVAEFVDAALSGGSMANRGGLQQLLTAASSHSFDAVLTESLDRLSRDLEHMAAIYKRLAYCGVKIITLADGEVGQLHVGLKGLIANLYLEDLAQKTRRGQFGRVQAGRIPGGLCFGYDVIRSGIDRGLRAINIPQAAVVRRIFEEYVSGSSPRAIAKALNLEGVAGPRGGLWSASTILGSRKRLNGVLNNSLYKGELIYNRQRFVKDPQTGRRQARGNSPSEWVKKLLPALQIVSSDIWDEAQKRRQASSRTHFSKCRRPKRLLSGLLRCSDCGGAYIVRTRDYVGCSRQINTGVCHNKRTVAMSEIERRVLSALEKHLLSPGAVDVAVEAYRCERERLSKAAANTKSQSEKALAEVKRRIARLLAAIETGADLEPLTARLTELDQQRVSLEHRLRVAEAHTVTRLHPHAAARYREQVCALQLAPVGDLEAIARIRELIEEIRIIPKGKGQPVGLEVVGDLATLMARENEPKSVTAMMVAGAGFEPTTFRL